MADMAYREIYAMNPMQAADIPTIVSMTAILIHLSATSSLH